MGIPFFREQIEHRLGAGAAFLVDGHQGLGRPFVLVTIFCMRRAMRSAPPPLPAMMMNSIGRDGFHAARACVVPSATVMNNVSARVRNGIAHLETFGDFIIFPPFYAAECCACYSENDPITG